MTTSQDLFPDDSTARLELWRPRSDDVDGLHPLLADARLWTHFPTLRHRSPAQTAAMLRRWMSAWAADGLGTWVVRDPASHAVLGYGGCSTLRGEAWNVGYRLAVEAQGRGLATEVARRGMVRAREIRPDLPMVAYLLEHNLASAAVARKLGLELVDRAPDAGNPDQSAVRLIFADRPLTKSQLDAAHA